MARDPAGQSVPLLRFSRQYLQLEPDLTYPDGILLREAASQEFLYETLFAHDATSSPLPPRYQLRVLKELVARIEDAIEDWDEHGISDNLMATLSHLMSIPLPSETTAAQQRCYVTYYQSLLPSSTSSSPSRAITLLESRSLISAAGTTGLRTWEAALHLGQYLCTHPSLVHSRRVLELGAGTGYLSVLCAKHLGANYVVTSDGSDDVVANLADSLFVNGLQGAGRISIMNLKWGHALVGTEEEAWNAGREVDLVLGADITYDKRLIPPLVATLEELLALFPGVQILISATERNRDTFQHFLDLCRGRGFGVEIVDFPVPSADEQMGPFYDCGTPIHICRIAPCQE